MSAADMLMKAVIRSEYGEADVLRITRLERPAQVGADGMPRYHARR